MWTDQQHAACLRLGDLNGDGGSAGPRGGKYEAHSERRFIKPAGALFASERLFSFCCGRGLLKPGMFPPVSQSLARKVITEQCL